MMILDVKKLNGLKKFSGTAEFSFAPQEDLIGIPYVSFGGEATAKISYEIFEDFSVEIVGELEFRLKGLCSRCLKETAQRKICKIDALFLPKDEGGEEYLYDGSKIDLTELFNDTVVFGMPSVFSCGEDCAGTPQQGGDANKA